jgi:hypothetical protein
MKLEDVQAHDEQRAPKYRSMRGRHILVYDAPDGLGVLSKIRGD